MKSSKILSAMVVFIFLSVSLMAQTAEEIVSKHVEAVGGKENWKKVTSMRMEATLNTQGIDVPIVITQIHNKARRTEFTAMNQTGYTIVTTEGGWTYNPFTGMTAPEALTPEQLKSEQDQLDVQGELIDYKEKGHQIELAGSDSINGRLCHKIKLTRKSGTSQVLYIESGSWNIVRVTGKAFVNGQETEATANFGNFLKLPEGIVVPMSMENATAPAPITVTKVEVNPKVDESIFKKPS